MSKSNSLVKGIGNTIQTKKYYDNWSKNYEISLK